MLNDVEAIAQLDWLWSSKLRENLVTPASTFNNVVEMAQVQHFNNVDGCDNTLNNDNDYLQQNNKYQQESHASKIKIKPIERYVVYSILLLTKTIYLPYLFQYHVILMHY